MIITDTKKGTVTLEREEAARFIRYAWRHALAIATREQENAERLPENIFAEQRARKAWERVDTLADVLRSIGE